VSAHFFVAGALLAMMIAQLAPSKVLSGSASPSRETNHKPRPFFWLCA
jgi:hypothetical protein